LAEIVEVAMPHWPKTSQLSDTILILRYCHWKWNVHGAMFSTRFCCTKALICQGKFFSNYELFGLTIILIIDKCKWIKSFMNSLVYFVHKWGLQVESWRRICLTLRFCLSEELDSTLAEFFTNRCFLLMFQNILPQRLYCISELDRSVVFLRKSPITSQEMLMAPASPSFRFQIIVLVWPALLGELARGCRWQQLHNLFIACYF
jgi:hypothetical protein